MTDIITLEEFEGVYAEVFKTSLEYGEVFGESEIPFVRLTPSQLQLVQDARHLGHKIRNMFWLLKYDTCYKNDLNLSRLSLTVELFKNYGISIRTFKSGAHCAERFLNGVECPVRVGCTG